MKENLYQKIYFWVRKIPKGKVATYGQIAALCGSPRAAQVVGYALHIIPENSKIPWHRVINSKGFISTTCFEHPKTLQRNLLVNEGIKIKDNNGLYTIDLKKYFWQP